MAVLTRKVASGAALGGLGFIAAALATLWATPYLYNGLGPEAYGVLGLLLGVQGVLMMVLATGGMGAVLVLLAGGDAAQLKERSQGMAAWTVLAATAALACGWLLGTRWVGGLFWKDELSLELWLEVAPWAGLAWAMQIMCQSLWSAQRARMRLASAELQAGLGQTLAILAGPWALGRGMGFSGVVEAQAVAWTLLFLAGLGLELSRKDRLALLPREHRHVWRDAWQIAGWTTVGFALASVLQYGDRFFALQSGERELAAYSVATSLVLRSVSLFGILGPMVLPAMAAAREDKARWAFLQSLFLRATGIGAGALFVPMAAGGAALLGAWVAPEVELRSQAWILLLASSGLALTLSNAYLSVLLAMGGGAEQGAYASAAGLVAGLGAGLLAQSLGGPGAAWMGAVGHLAMVLWRGGAVASLGLGRSHWGWAYGTLPWLAGAVAGTYLLQALGFPRWFGAGLLPILLAFALAGSALLAVALVADWAVSLKRGRQPLWAQLLRVRQGQAA